MDQFTIYSIKRQGKNVFHRRITDFSFPTFQEGRSYAIKLAEKFAALRGEKIEMLTCGLRFGDEEYLVAKVRD